MDCIPLMSKDSQTGLKSMIHGVVATYFTSTRLRSQMATKRRSPRHEIHKFCASIDPTISKSILLSFFITTFIVDTLG